MSILRVSATARVFAVLLAFHSFPFSATSDEITDRLLGLVSKDAALVVEIPKFAEQVERVGRSDFYNRLVSSELYKNWTESDRYKSLTKSRESIERSTARPFAQLRRQVFGNGLVVALHKIGDNRFAGVIIAEAESATVLDEAIVAWNKSESQNTTTLLHAGQTYFRRDRVRPDKPVESLYYAKFGRTYVLTDSEDRIQPVLELHSRRSETGENAATKPVSILDSSSFRTSRAAIRQAPFIAAYINPRDWDSAFPIA
ncbi:MAG: hypothetical protein AB7O26_16840, partial [Planctomycetaceae bacterium]